MGRHYEEFLPDKTTRRAVLQVIQHRLTGLGHRASQPAHLKRPYRVSRAAPTALQLAGLVQIANTNTGREPLLLETNRAVGNRGGLLRHGLGFDGVGGLFASQPGHFAVQSGYDARQPSHPLCLPLARREAHLLSILVSKEPLSQGPVPALHDALVPVDVNTSTSDLDLVFGEQLAHRTNELAPRVNLKELRPPKWAPLVNPSQAIGNLCRGLASQRLSLFVARDHINDRESVAEGFPPYAVVWQKEQIRLVGLVRRGDVKLRPRYAPWAGRKICQMACLLSQSLACCSVTFAADASFSMAGAPSSSLGGCSIGQRACCRPLLLRYSSSLTSLQHAEATGSGSCPVVARRLVWPASSPATKRIAVFSSCRQSSSDFCAISIMLWVRGPGILWRRAACPTASIARYSSSAALLAYSLRRNNSNAR